MSKSKTKYDLIVKSLEISENQEFDSYYNFWWYDGIFFSDDGDHWDDWVLYNEDKRRDDIITEVLDLNPNPKFGDLWPK